MTDLKKEEANLLEDLVQTCLEGEKGYSQAAESVEDLVLKELFSRLSTQRAGFASEIQELQKNIAEDVTESGSISGAIHRGWIGFKNMLPGTDEDSILSECERGDEHALEKYSELSETLVHPNANEVLTRQRAHIVEALSEIRRYQKVS